MDDSFFYGKIDLHLVNVLENATRSALLLLFDKHKEDFYYCSLITDGAGHCPYISAWSREALQKALQYEDNPEEARKTLKWSYADSPYFAFGEEFFAEAKEAFNSRKMDIDDEKLFQQEFDLRINSMERVMANLDKEGLFGRDEKRLRIVINAEVMPPDYTNTERALRLNPIDALSEWLEEAAEE